MNQMQKCKCRDWCFLRYYEGHNERKMEMRSYITAEQKLLEEEDADSATTGYLCPEVVDVDNENRLLATCQNIVLESEDIPEGCWDGLIERARISKKRNRRGRALPFTRQEQIGVDQDESGENEWDFVECLGFLSDAESWEEDFDTISCWSV